MEKTAVEPKSVLQRQPAPLSCLKVVLLLPLFSLILLFQPACGAATARVAGEVVLRAAIAGDAAHAEQDDAIVYREEARERRRAYVQRRGDELAGDLKEAILDGYVRDGMTRTDVEASVGSPQRTISTRTEDGLELTWIYTDDVQLSHRGWDTLEVTFRQDFQDEEQLEWLKAHPEAIVSGEAAAMVPDYRVVAVGFDR